MFLHQLKATSVFFFLCQWRRTRLSGLLKFALDIVDNRGYATFSAAQS